MFAQLDELVIGGFGRVEEEGWVRMMEKALNVVFYLSEEPEITGRQSTGDTVYWRNQPSSGDENADISVSPFSSQLKFALCW